MQQLLHKNSMGFAFALCISCWGQRVRKTETGCCYCYFLVTAVTLRSLRILLFQTGMHPPASSQQPHFLTTTEMHIPGPFLIKELYVWIIQKNRYRDSKTQNYWKPYMLYIFKYLDVWSHAWKVCMIRMKSLFKSRRPLISLKKAS